MIKKGGEIKPNEIQINLEKIKLTDPEYCSLLRVEDVRLGNSLRNPLFFGVQPGEILGIISHSENMSKRIILSIAGVECEKEGKIGVGGQRVTGEQRTSRIPRVGMTPLVDLGLSYDEVYVLSHLRACGMERGLKYVKAEEEAIDLIKKLQLPGLFTQERVIPAQIERFKVAVALIGSPELVCLLNPLSEEEILMENNLLVESVMKEYLKKANTGLVICLSSQEIASRICSKVVVLDSSGQISVVIPKKSS